MHHEISEPSHRGSKMSIIIETQPEMALIGTHVPRVESKFLNLHCLKEQKLLEPIPDLLLLEELPKLLRKVL